MKEIKFRYVLRDKETKAISTMHYTLEEIEAGSIHTDFAVLGLIDRTKYDVVARLQYSGMKDTNGVEIYEGDIVLLEEYYWGDTSKEDPLAVTEWHEYDCGFVFRLIGSCGGRLHVSEYTSKVVGNKYENPEKLKVWIRREL